MKDQNYSLITGRVIGNAAPLALLRKADFSSVSYKQRKMLGEVVIVEILWGWYVGKVLRVEPQGADDAIYTVVVDQSQREGVVTCRSHQMGKLSSVGKQMAQLASPYLSQVLCKQDYAERFQVRQLSKAEAVLEKNYMESQLKEPQTKEKLNTEISGELFRLEARGEKFWQEYDPRWNSFWNRYFGRYGLAVQRLEESSFSALQLLRQFYSSSSHRNDPRALRCFVNYHHSPHSKWRPMINKPVPLWLLKRTLFGAAGRPGKVATTWRWVVYEHKLRGIYVFGRAISQENQMNRRGYKVKVLEIGDYDPLIQNSLGRAFMGPCIRWVAEELLGFFPEALLPLPEPPSRRFSSMASSHGVASSTLVDPLARHASLSATSLPKRSSQDLY